MSTIPTLTGVTSTSSDSLSTLIEQLVYVLDENESIFYVRTLNDTRSASKIDRFLLTLAILTQGGYVSSASNSDFQRFELDNFYGTVFHHYLNTKFTVRNHEVFRGRWHRSQSGHWSYVVV